MIQFKPMNTAEEWQFIESRAHAIMMADSMGVVAYDDDSKTIQAVCVADTFTRDACSLHVAIDNPMVLRHGFIQHVFNHLYHNCGRERIFGVVPSSNTRALKFDFHIGFREVARIGDAIAEGIDSVIVRMDKKDCRWIAVVEHLEEAA